VGWIISPIKASLRAHFNYLTAIKILLWGTKSVASSCANKPTISRNWLEIAMKWPSHLPHFVELLWPSYLENQCLDDNNLSSFGTKEEEFCNK